MKRTTRIFVAWSCMAGSLLGAPREIQAGAPDADFFGAGLEEFTGLRRSDVQELADDELDGMRGRFGEFYLGFDGSSLGPHQSGVVVSGAIPSRGGSLVGQVTVRDSRTSSAFELTTNLLTDSFNNTQGVVQLVQIAGNNNVVYQNLNVDVAVFFGSSTQDPNYAAFRNFVQARGGRP